MDKGKEKRRKSDKESEEDQAIKKKLREGEKEAAAAATEEEVEEFFAILRKMQVAVKYFEKGNGEGWPAAVEADVVAVVGGVDNDEDDNKEDRKMMIKNKRAKEVMVVGEESGALDLNVMPEAESS